ncbi:hypothetical protein LAE98_30985 [Bacillus wiedmannii]|uniref:efflux RND transporter periplasmic adaptor subunit n=1 Tax=Bacillus wiedmannii TaxID=1890302 RepID=UPI001CC17510|nr:hypothetical protein [Bacillus wiedmannii]MBZ4226411.1 hypothetical protein [Bacillus wiedmannii]
MKKKKIAFLCVIIIVSLILIMFSYIGMNDSKHKKSEKQYSLFTVEKTPKLLFKGVSQAEYMEEFYFDPNLGELDSFLVKDGQSVKKFDVIATYKNPLVQEEFENQKVELERLKISVVNAKENLNNAEKRKIKIESDITNYSNQKRNLEHADKDNEKILELSSKIEQSQNELEMQVASIIQSKQLLEEAEIAFKSHNKNIDRLSKKTSVSIISQLDGIVYLDKKGIKDSNIPFAKIVTPKTIIKGNITDYDYENIKVDQRVNVKSLNQSIETGGKIQSINPLPDSRTEESDISQYSFFVETDETVHYGYNVQISIDLDILKIPEEAIIKEGNNSFVYRYFKNRVYKTKVDIEEVRGEYIIKSGLKENSKIISDPDNSLGHEKEVQINDKNE